MAGETFLLSGDQIATYREARVSFPDGVATISLGHLRVLGPPESRFFLVRTKGEGEIVKNGQFFTVHAAVPDGKGGYHLGKKALFKPNWATPDAYENTGAGDRYLLFGLFDGTRFAVDLDGFEGARTATYVRGKDRVPGGDGELGLSEIKAASPDVVVCFAAGTPIETDAGPCPVERLEVGTRVLTVDRGLAPVRWIGGVRIALGPGPHPARPVRIGAGALAPGVPSQEIVVSPAHRFLVSGALCEVLTGTAEALVPAHHLVGQSGIARAADVLEVVYWHFAFDGHEIVFSAGARSESLHPGRQALGTLGADARRELLALFPSLRAAGNGPPMSPGRSVLRAHEARVVARLTGRAESGLRIG